MKKRILAFMVILLLVMSLMTGCGGNSKEKSGDEIIVGIDADAIAMDPLSINDTITMSILSNVYEPLVRVTPAGEVYEGLADKWEISEDGLEYTFHIRDGVTFHNGDALTMEDVKWSIEAQVESSHTGPYIGCIDHVEIVDDSTIKVVLSYPYSPFLTLCGTYSYVMKEAYYGEGYDMTQQPIGCGPYKFVSWKANDKIEFTAFEDYYAGVAPIKSLTYKIIPNQTSAAISLESGDIDMYQAVAESDVKTLEENDEITVDASPSSAFYYMGLNTKDSVLKDERVRQAIAKAINREDLIIGVLDGYGKEAKSFVAEGLPGYRDSFDPLPYDIEGAKKLLSDAGYPNGLKLNIVVPESRSTHAQIIQSNLREIGIDLNIDIKETGAFWDDVENFNYQIMMMGWSYVVMDNDVGYYSLYKSDETVSGNYPQFNDPHVDELLQKGRESSDLKERDTIYAEIEEIVMGSGAYIPCYWSYNIIAYNAKLKGVSNSPCGFYFVYDYSWKE